MIFHASIPADDPERVARVVAEIWRGEAFRFPPWPGGWVAMAGDERNTTLEVYPRNHTVAPGERDEPARVAPDPAPPRYGCFHLAVATSRPAEEVQAIAQREGWRAVTCNRGGLFDVIELWVENSLLIEVLTEPMQRDYLANLTMDHWRKVRPPAAAPA